MKKTDKLVLRQSRARLGDWSLRLSHLCLASYFTSTQYENSTGFCRYTDNTGANDEDQVDRFGADPLFHGV